MDLVIYNRANTKADAFAEPVYLRIAMMYTNQVSISSFISEYMIMWHCKQDLGEIFCCIMYETINKQRNGEWVKFHDKLKQVRNTKNKNKVQIVAHQKMERLMKQVAADVLKWLENIMEQHKLIPLLQFFEQSVKTRKEEVSRGDGMDEFEIFPFMLVNNKEYKEETVGEDPLIKEIVDSFFEYDQNLILDDVIEQLVPFTRLDGGEITAESFFFSTPLFEFPHLHDLNYDQLKNVRNELKPIVESFHQDYKKIQKELAAVPFENSLTQVQAILNLNITPHLEKIQKKIDENIYVQQQKSRYGAEQRIKILMGITSVENQIRLLEKEEVILPFVAEAIIEKLGKNIDIKSSMPFIYHKLPPKVSSQ
ncbi:MAG: hypothetical protein HY841_13795 [Bacteroidetes bacterium]|nr:hypothetical protein [Bacteroidota bacterium]